MARKGRVAPLQQRPPSPSSEEVESEEEEEVEEEEEENPPSSQPTSDRKALGSQKKTKSTSTPAKSAQFHQVSSSDAESDSDDDESDSDSAASGRLNSEIKSIPSKSMDDGGSKIKKANPKPVVLASAAKTPAASGSKRSAAESAQAVAGSKEPKRARKEKGGGGGGGQEETGEKKAGGDESKKQLFKRVWTEADEIAVLKGMIEYSEEKGTDPMSDAADFHDFVKKSLHVDLDKRQIVNKLRRLRKKCENNMVKRRTLTPHEKHAFELSKKIWGNLELPTGMLSTKRNGVVMAAEEKEVGNVGKGKLANVGKGKLAMGINLGNNLTAMGLDESVVKDGLKLLDSSKRAELEDKWRMLRLDEMEVYVKRMNLIQEQTILILDAMRSAKQ